MLRLASLSTVLVTTVLLAAASPLYLSVPSGRVLHAEDIQSEELSSLQDAAHARALEVMLLSRSSQDDHDIEFHNRMSDVIEELTIVVTLLF